MIRPILIEIEITAGALSVGIGKGRRHFEGEPLSRAIEEVANAGVCAFDPLVHARSLT